MGKRRTQPVSDSDVQIYWVVADMRGPHRVNDASQDVFESYSEAQAECKNRGQGYSPLVLNPQEVLRGLVEENLKLREENQRLRAAIDTTDDFQNRPRGRVYDADEDLI